MFHGTRQTRAPLATRASALSNGVAGVQRGDAGWSIGASSLRTPLSLRIAALRNLDPDNPDTDGDGMKDYYSDDI